MTTFSVFPYVVPAQKFSAGTTQEVAFRLLSERIFRKLFVLIEMVNEQY